VAPDYYFRKGDPDQDHRNGPALFPVVNAKTDRRSCFADLDAAVAWAKVAGAATTDRLGIMGLLSARGGPYRVALFHPTATSRPGVAFYGSLADPPSEAIADQTLIASAKEVKGGRCSASMVRKIRAISGRSGQADGKRPSRPPARPPNSRFYPGARPHGFHADYRPSYRKEAADDAWSQNDRLVSRNTGVLS